MHSDRVQGVRGCENMLIHHDHDERGRECTSDPEGEEWGVLRAKMRPGARINPLGFVSHDVIAVEACEVNLL
eukprot:288077-Amorphochlora_amoeboformis.AAC.3